MSLTINVLLSGGGGVALYHANGVASYMKGSPRISYPFFSTSTPKKIITPILALLRNMRGEEMRVERRHTTAIVPLVVRTSVTAGGWFLYPPTTIVQGVWVMLSGKRDRDVHVREGNRALCYVCLLYTSPSPRDKRQSRMPSSA